MAIASTATSAFLLLLRVRLQALRNSFAKARGARRFRPILLLVFWGWIVVWIGLAGYETFRGLQAMDPSGRSVHAMVYGMLFGISIVLFLGGSTFALSLLLLSGETAFLLSAPVPRRTIFGFRLLEAGFLNGVFVFAFLLPQLITLGMALGAGALYYPVAIAVAFLFLFLLTDLGTILSFGVARLFPPKRARELLSALMGLSFLAVWLAMDYAHGQVSTPQVATPAELWGPLLERFRAPFLPSSWAGGILLSLLDGKVWSALGGMGLLLVTVVLLHSVTARLADDLWLRGFPEAATHRKRGARRAEEAIVSGGAGWSEFLRREVRMLVRDFQQLSRIAVIAVFGLLFPLLSRGSDADGGPWPVILMPLGLIALAASQFAALLIPLEGKAFWLVKIGPGGVRRVLIAKWMLSTLCTAILLGASSAVVATILDAGLRVLYLAPSWLFLGATISAIGIFIGAGFGRFDWEHPRRTLRSPGSTVLLLLALGVVAVAVGPPIAVHALGKASVAETLVLVSVTTLATGIVACVLFLTPAMQRLQKLEWTY